jgi:hypothetical protein
VEIIITHKELEQLKKGRVKIKSKKENGTKGTRNDTAGNDIELGKRKTKQGE